MVSPVGPKDEALTLKFGGGLHTRASEDEIDPREAAGGKNFELDPENRELRPRKPFDLVGTMANGQAIRGGGSYLKADGTVSFCVQAGDKVYEWDGLSTFAPIATVNESARLRGHHRTHNWGLGDELLFTDLALTEPIKKWNGTTFQNVSFTNEIDAAFGNFYAKYLVISNERALFSHVRDPNATTPHMMVGAKREDYTQITVTNRPASALSEEDPFYLLSPDLRPINGYVEAFGAAIISTNQGQIFNLTGASAKDFAFSDFYPGSAASGDEALSYIGNDIVYGRQGRLESVRDTDRFGDAESDDLTFQVADDVKGYTDWTLIYNSRLNRVYAFPAGQSEVWVLQTAMRGGDLSPWMRWTTSHSIAFQPTFVMSMLDPQDKLEYVFMGDNAGNLYRMEGTGLAGDGGVAPVDVEWLSRLFSAGLDAQVYNVEGQIKYRKGEAATVRLTVLASGTTAFNESLTIDLPVITGRPVYGGGFYYGGAFYGAPFEGRLVKQRFAVPGQFDEAQFRIEVSGTTGFQINEIRLRLTEASV